MTQRTHGSMHATIVVEVHTDKNQTRRAQIEKALRFARDSLMSMATSNVIREDIIGVSEPNIDDMVTVTIPITVDQGGPLRKTRGKI